MQELLSKLESEIKEIFATDSTGHDIYHLKRTMNLALHIQKIEGGDEVVIAVAALLHDIHRIMSVEAGRFVTPKESLPKVREILDRTELEEEQKDRILHCIEFHEEYNFSKTGNPVSDIETLILQDADNLEAIGAIGIGRTFTFGGAHGITMWDPNKPFEREHYDESEYDPSTLHHFHSKLIKLTGNMNTETAKKMAEERHIFLEKFIEEFMDEWNGVK